MGCPVNVPLKQSNEHTSYEIGLGTVYLRGSLSTARLDNGFDNGSINPHSLPEKRSWVNLFDFILGHSWWRLVFLVPNLWPIERATDRVAGQVVLWGRMQRWRLGFDLEW